MDNNFTTNTDPSLEPNQMPDLEHISELNLQESSEFEPIEQKKPNKLVSVLIALLKSVGFIAIMLAIDILISLGAEIIAILFHPNLSEKELLDLITSWSINLTFIRNLAVIGVFALIYALMRKPFLKKIKAQVPHKSSYLPTLAIGATGQFVTMLALNLITQLLPQSWLDSFNQNNEIMESANGVMLFITTVFLAPLFEEILCRGLILNTLQKAMPKWVAIVLSSAIFGIIHGNPIQFIYATALGIILGWLYTKYDSIYIPMLCHLMFNLTSMILSYLDTENMVVTLIAGLIMYLSIPVFILSIIFVNLKRMDKKQEPITVPNQEYKPMPYAPKPEYNADALARLQAEIEGKSYPKDNNGDNL